MRSTYPSNTSIQSDIAGCLALILLKKKHLFLHHQKANNVGDIYCNPAMHFSFKSYRNVPYTTNVSSASSLTFAGGNVFDEARRFTARSKQSTFGHRIAWGIGLPAPGRRDDQIQNFADSCELFSTRDFNWKARFHFVPCASCMSRDFDQQHPETHERVFFFHKSKTKPELLASADGPVMHNTKRKLSEVLRFLSSGRTVITNSYHGVYWAHLLGKRTICIPFGEKFRTYRQLPTFAADGDWQAALRKAAVFSSDLEEYRSINTTFYKKFLEITQS